MTRRKMGILRTVSILVFCITVLSSCSSSASNKYFGKTVAPSKNVLRYITGPEPETFDPQLPDGQPEARIFLALYDGLVEYGPKDQQPIPALARSWEINTTYDEFIFHIRDGARWSDDKPITAKDFVYSLRRGFAPETISRTAGNGYVIKYAEAFNGDKVFVKKGGSFLLEKDFGGGVDRSAPTAFGPETEFHKFINSSARLTIAGDEKKRAKEIAADPKLAAAVEGAEFVPIKAEDIGVEAVDDYTLRITLRQSAPYFVGLLAHQFFRLVPQHAIEKWGKEWTRPEHIVTCGAFRVKEFRPYDACARLDQWSHERAGVRLHDREHAGHGGNGDQQPLAVGREPHVTVHPRQLGIAQGHRRSRRYVPQLERPSRWRRYQPAAVRTEFEVEYIRGVRQRGAVRHEERPRAEHFDQALRRLTRERWVIADRIGEPCHRLADGTVGDQSLGGKRLGSGDRRRVNRPTVTICHGRRRG